MSVATCLSGGLGVFGNIATILTDGLATYTELPQPPPAGYAYQDCTSTSFVGDSLQMGSTPPVAIGDVFVIATNWTLGQSGGFVFGQSAFGTGAF